MSERLGPLRLALALLLALVPIARAETLGNPSAPPSGGSFGRRAHPFCAASRHHKRASNCQTCAGSHCPVAG
jgi:hypothetical protein